MEPASSLQEVWLKENDNEKLSVNVALSALGHMHGIYLSHFALNPWNIFFRRRGSEVIFKIGDFGMEIHSDYRAESKIGQEGPHSKYIAPEVNSESEPEKAMKERNAPLAGLFLCSAASAVCEERMV